MLEDRGGSVSAVYVGLENDETARPGIVIVRPDGHIAYRHIGDGAGDRIQAPQLVSIIDTQFGAPKAPAAALHGDYSPAKRVQLRVDVGIDVAQRVTAADPHPPLGGRASASVLVPVGPWGLVGGLVRGETGDPPLADFDAALKLRKLVLGDVAEFYALVPLGVTTTSKVGWNAGGHLGVQAAATPFLALYTQLGATYYDLEGTPLREQLRYSLDLGVSVLP